MKEFNIFHFTEVSPNGETLVRKETIVEIGQVPNQKKGLKMTHINPKKVDDPLSEDDKRAGMWRCHACAMPIWNGSGAAGVTVGDTCPYCHSSVD
ncbi:MAG: hypothetical protein V1732_01645 [Patescibacteria group bacterium]